MTKWRLVKLVLAVSAIAILGLSVAAGVAASRNSDSNDSNDVVLQGDESNAHTWLGIQARTSHDPDGVAITSVVDDSPADVADLETDDVIVAVNGNHTKNPAALKKALRNHSAGDEVTLSVVKAGAGDPTDVTVVLGERPDSLEFHELGRIDEFREGLHDGLLDGITEAFDHFLDLNLHFLDDERNVVELEAVSGTVIAVSDSDITIETTDGDEQTFALTDDTHMSEDLTEGDRVVVISIDGEVKAVTGPGLGIFRRHFDLGLPFEDPTFEFDLPFERGEGHFDFEFDFDLGESRFCRDGEGFPWSKDNHPNFERLHDKLCTAEPESTPAP